MAGRPGRWLGRIAPAARSRNDCGRELERADSDGGACVEADLLFGAEADEIVVPSGARHVGAVNPELEAPVQLQDVPLAADRDLGGRARAEVGVVVDRDTPPSEGV